MIVKCNIISGVIRDLAKQLKLGESYTCNLVSVWQTQNNSVDYPTALQLKELLTQEEEQSMEIALAVPTYKTAPFDASKSLATTSAKSNEITLRYLPEENPIDYFFSYIQGSNDTDVSKQKKKVFEDLQKEGYTLEELRKLLLTPEDVYRFLLWHEMSHKQNTDSKTYWANGNDLMTSDKIAIETRATKDAWKKAKVWREKHPEENKNNVYEVPQIGTEELEVNNNDARIRLARDFTPLERSFRVEMLSRNFTTIVDKAIAEKTQEISDAINEEMSKENPDRNELLRLQEKAILFNDPVEGRRAVINEKTLTQIFKEMRQEIEDYASMSVEDADEDYGKGKGQQIVDAYQKVLDNWEALLDEACVFIESRENLRVITDKYTFNDGKKESEVVSGITEQSADDAQNDEESTDDDEEGNRADGNGGWSYKVRFINPSTSLTKQTKSILGNIQRETNGEPETDDLGNILYLNEEYAHNVLLSELSDMIDADDFCIKDDNGDYIFPALEKATKKYPWVNQVINALQADPSLISSFYADLRKDHIPYWMQYYDDKDNKWKTKALNQASAFDSTRTSILNNYEQGITLDKNSVYEAGRTLSNSNAQLGFDLVNDVLSKLRDFDEDDYETITANITKALRMVGLNTKDSIIRSLIDNDEGVVSLRKTVNALRNIFDGIRDLPENSHLIDAFSNYFDVISKEMGTVSEIDNMASFRIDKKTYYSYSAPNYLDTMFKTFKSDERRDAYLQNEFGKYKWFKENGRWRNEWLNLIDSDEDVRDQLALKELININGEQYSNWKPREIKKAFIREYFSVGINKGSKKQFAWYNMPIFSDSPVCKFIKFLRYTTDNEGTYVDKLLPLLRNVVKQELSRIKLVRERIANNVSPIANFDKNGLKFMFFPELNEGTFLEEAIGLADEENLDTLNELIDNSLMEIMSTNFSSFMTNNFNENDLEILGKDLIDSGVITSQEQLNDALSEYFWNQAFATTQIIQLTTTDLAYHKDGIDFQKRFKEVYAAGTKLFTSSEYGKKIERTLYLKDQLITSSGYQDIKKVLDKAVKEGRIKSYDRDNILDKFKDINVADAQAYRSLDSMRSVLDMLGKWTPAMQESYDRFKEGKWDMLDFNIVWQTIKPFVYTQVEKPDGVGGVIKVPHQNKNSEFLLLAMHSMIANSIGKSPKLKAMNRFMQENNIDVIQFESAVKVGKEGVVDIRYSDTKLQKWYDNNEKEEKAIKEVAYNALGKKYDTASGYDIFKAGNDALLDKGKISQEEYNDRFESIEPSEDEVYGILESMSMDSQGFKPEVIHELPYKDYCIQQPNPEHLFDTTAVFGSQFRNLIVSDMPDDPNFRVNVNGKLLTKQQVLDLYNSCTVENLLEDFEEVKRKVTNIEALQKTLIDTVKGNPKYGRDMLDALQIVEITNPITHKKEKVFNIPLDDPLITTQIQEIVTSVFKNGITKQHIKGASCVLVSDFGLTKELNILYNEDGSIKGIECYLPAYSKKFYEPLSVTKVDEDGNEYQELDINKLPLELRKMIGYRIPTEGKYSMVPLIVKGFLPQQNGSSIMLPADITTIAGSDFDVDKLFMMIPEFESRRIYDVKSAWDTFYIENPEVTSQIEEAQWSAFRSSYSNALKKNSVNAQDIDVDDKAFKDWFVKESGLKKYEWADGVQDKFEKWYKKNKHRFYKTTEFSKIKYDISKPAYEQGRNARAKRNNMLIDISWGILTNSTTAEKILSPGNFDKVKIAARVARITSSPELLEAFVDKYGLKNQEGAYDTPRIVNHLFSLSRKGNLKELNDFISDYSKERSQLTVDTFIYNHRQNMTGAALIGIYANNTTAQAKFQTSSLALKDDYTFVINGRKIQSLHDMVSPIGELISKNCAEFSAASVDNVKDPVLAELMQNTDTAKIAGFMLRAGMSMEEIGLLFSQPLVRKCIDETGNLDSLGIYINKANEELKDSNVRPQNKAITTRDYTSAQLMSDIITLNFGAKNDDYYNALVSSIETAMLMQHIAKLADSLNDLTGVTRADSPNGAIKPSIAGAANQVQKLRLIERQVGNRKYPFTGINTVISNEAVSLDMSKGTMRDKFMGSNMSRVQAFHSLGIVLPLEIIGKYFSQTTSYITELKDQLQENSRTGIVSDSVLDSFYKDLIEFALSATNTFGNDGNMTFDEKRDYYLYEYPSEYIKVIKENPDIANLSIFRRMQVKDGDIVMSNSSGLISSRSKIKDVLMRDLDTLLSMDNPVAQKLALDLFKYAYYKEGLRFGPNNFSSFFSTNFKSQLLDYIKSLREVRMTARKGTYYDNFLAQFYANHWQDRTLVPTISENVDVIVMSNNDIAVPANACFNKNTLYRSNPNSKDGNSFPFIIYSNTLFSLKSDGRDRAIYTLSNVLSDIQKSKRGIKYNANVGLQDLTSYTPDETKVKANSQINPTSSGFTLNDSQLNQLDELFNGGYEDGAMMDALSALEQQYSESEGESQLDEPLCKSK